MKVIALCGNSETGKTTTLNRLIDNLMKEQVYIIKNPRKTANENKDRVILLSYKEKIIGITTYGDAPIRVRQDYEHLRDHIAKNPHNSKTVIDILICASHFSRQAIDNLFHIANDGNSEQRVYEPILVLMPDLGGVHCDELTNEKVEEIQKHINN